MTKLSNMDLPKRGMYYCGRCKEWVPAKEKHNRKIHPHENPKEDLK